MDLEHRAAGEIRTQGRTLFGLAAPFDRSADIGPFRETIARGAFAQSVARDDIRALADHQTTSLLGRTKSGTLTLRETGQGLEYSLDLPDTSLGNDLLSLARRGDLSGVSIGFVADDEAWPDQRTRTLRRVSLHEVSIITGGRPAYPDTSIAVRHRDRLGPGAIALKRLRLFLSLDVP